MRGHILTPEKIERFGSMLRSEERAPATIEKYLRDVRAFVLWLDGGPVVKDAAARWKAYLRDSGLSPATVNAKLSALNTLFHFLGWEDCRVRFLKIQRRVFRDTALELSQAEYEQLLETARGRGQDRLALLMETICAAVFYRATRDIAKLADVLGHSSINTTRIYLMSTGAEHARQIERLRLVS